MLLCDALMRLILVDTCLRLKNLESSERFSIVKSKQRVYLLLLQQKRIVVGNIYFVMIQVCSESDYEMWNPPGNDQCLMGRKVTMQRRKPTANCFNDKRWARAGATYQPCQCEHVSVCMPQNQAC